MTHESLLNRDRKNIVERLGGRRALGKSARDTKAVLRARVIESAVDLPRMILAYCLGEKGPAHGRLIRIIDGTTVPKAGAIAKTKNRLWRIHGAFDLPAERFGCFELADEKGGETLDRIPAVKGLIRIADRAFPRASPSSRFAFSLRAESARN